MRIAHVYKDSYPPVFGGIEQHIALLAQAQVSAGHSVQVVVAGGGYRGDSFQVEGVHIRQLPEIGRFGSSPFTPYYIPVLRKLHVDIVHFHHPNPIGEIAEPFLPEGVVRVVSYHADITRQRVMGALYRPLLRRFLQRADCLITSSPHMLATSPVLRPHGRRVHIVPYGVTASAGRGAQERRPKSVLFVGRLREYKGLPVLLDALGLLPDAQLRVAGRGPMENRLAEQAHRNRLDNRVKFLGDLDERELDSEYRRARALVLPSTRRSEAFGIVVAEALARGTPCVTTELGTGTSWVNQHETTGWRCARPCAGSGGAVVGRRQMGAFGNGSSTEGGAFHA
jgi:glycosyltransferase involved in cell wall biosynthesis